jgi:cytochrome c peroxidase
MRKKLLVPAVILAGCMLFVWYCKPSSTNSGFAALLPPGITDTFYLNPNNPYTAAKANLGRYLFYDRRMSANQTKSCASCHDPKFSFTDNYRRSIGALGDLHQRNAPPLINLIFYKYLSSADSSLHFPEQQISNPMFHDQPVELGWKGNEATLLARFRNDSLYRQLFKQVFTGDAEPISIPHIQQSIASFVVSLIALNSPYDRYHLHHQGNAPDSSTLLGQQLFFSDRLNCGRCHGGINFATPAIKDDKGNTQFYFNTGLYNIDGKGSYPAYDPGLAALTGNPADMGSYRVPTLRNLLFTAPYFHDGSAATLDEVIDLYINGGRLLPQGPFKGDGRTNPYKHPLIKGFQLNSQERSGLIHFLISLTDSGVITNSLYSNPFKQDETTIYTHPK